MKKSEIRLIIVGITSLVISVLLAVATVVVFITNLGMNTDFEKIGEGFDSITSTVESVADDIESAGNDISDTIEEIDSIDL